MARQLLDLANSNLGGGSLVAGQRLEVEDADIRDERVGGIPCPVWSRPHTGIKVVLGPQQRFFASRGARDPAIFSVRANRRLRQDGSAPRGTDASPQHGA